MSTIFAVSSGRPPAAIAVLRISGPRATAALLALTGKLPPPRHASLRHLRHPMSGLAIDQALVLYFPGPSTATGEDVVELHVHGGRAVVRATEEALASVEGLRPAEAGEFTRRALANGRMDLSQAEGLGDLLIAETEAQRRAALANAEGAVRRLMDRWAITLNRLSAAVEAMLDHADEDDVAGEEERLVCEVQQHARALLTDVTHHLWQPAIERLRDGIRVVLAGPPNSGKSTLLNVLIGRDAAIVSPIAGTTRDRIEAAVQRNGTAWTFIDTAGLAESTDDPIERIGIERSRLAITSADIILWMGDAEPPPVDAPVLALHARSDIPGRHPVPPGRIAVSASVGDLAELWASLDAIAPTLLPAEDSVALNDRQRSALQALEASLCELLAARNPLLLGEHLRRARVQVDTVTGRTGTEAMLDALFANFCIGK